MATDVRGHLQVLRPAGRN